MKKSIFYSIICTGIVFFMSTICFSQGKADTTKVKSDKALTATQVKAKFDELKASKNENATKKMSQSMEGKGFKAENGYFGNESTIEKEGVTLTNTIYIQDYKKGTTTGALGIISISDGKNVETYTFSLEKTGNNLNDVTEHFVNEKLEIVKANSWYSCLYKALQARCGVTAGLKLLNSCWTAYASASWSSFLNCIKGAWCGVTSLACCTCDCSWWCKYAAGCCDR